MISYKFNSFASTYSDSIGEKDSDAPTYLDMLKFNTETIVNALTAEKSEPTPEEKESGTRVQINLDSSTEEAKL